MEIMARKVTILEDIRKELKNIAESLKDLIILLRQKGGKNDIK